MGAGAAMNTTTAGTVTVTAITAMTMTVTMITTKVIS